MCFKRSKLQRGETFGPLNSWCFAKSLPENRHTVNQLVRCLQIVFPALRWYRENDGNLRRYYAFVG
jgi:hypothetical protein